MSEWRYKSQKVTQISYRFFSFKVELIYTSGKEKFTEWFSKEKKKI